MVISKYNYKGTDAELIRDIRVINKYARMVQDDPNKDNSGICSNMINASVRSNGGRFRYNSILLKQIFMSWPNCISPVYPVENSAAIYEYNKMNKDMWNTDTKYGALRWELLQYIIDVTTELMETYNET